MAAERTFHSCRRNVAPLLERCAEHFRARKRWDLVHDRIVTAAVGRTEVDADSLPPAQSAAAAVAAGHTVVDAGSLLGVHNAAAVVHCVGSHPLVHNAAVVAHSTVGAGGGTPPLVHIAAVVGHSAAAGAGSLPLVHIAAAAGHSAAAGAGSPPPAHNAAAAGHHSAAAVGVGGGTPPPAHSAVVAAAVARIAEVVAAAFRLKHPREHTRRPNTKTKCIRVPPSSSHTQYSSHE